MQCDDCGCILPSADWAIDEVYLMDNGKMLCRSCWNGTNKRSNAEWVEVTVVGEQFKRYVPSR